MTPEQRRRFVPIFEVLFAVIAWGASFVATKLALKDIQPVTVIWLRFSMGVVILGINARLRRQLTLPKTRELAYFAFLGFLGITFHQWLQSTAMLTASATTSAWIITTSPVFIAILGQAILKEQLTWLKAAGILAATLGVTLVISKGNVAGIFAGSFGSLGDFLMVLSAVNWAVFSVLSRRALRGYPAALMILYVMGFGWLLSTIFFFGGPGWADIANLSQAGWSGILFLGIVCSGLAYIAWYDALQALPASQAGVFIYLEPLVTMLVAFFVLSENPTWASLLGGAIILFGVWLVNRQS